MGASLKFILLLPVVTTESPYVFDTVSTSVDFCRLLFVIHTAFHQTSGQLVTYRSGLGQSSERLSFGPKALVQGPSNDQRTPQDTISGNILGISKVRGRSCA